jgi:hypothetical protein
MKPATPFRLTLLLLAFGFSMFFALNTAQAQARLRTADCPRYEQRQEIRQQQNGQRGNKTSMRNAKNAARCQNQQQLLPRRQQRGN